MHSYVIFNLNQEKNLLGFKVVDNSNYLNSVTRLLELGKFAKIRLKFWNTNSFSPYFCNKLLKLMILQSCICNKVYPFLFR